MSTEIENLMRDSMNDFTAAVCVPAGLGVKAYQRHRRRTIALRVTAAAAALATAAGALAAGLAAPGRAAPPAAVAAHDAAYIVRQAAKAAQSHSDRVEFLQETFYSTGTTASGHMQAWIYQDRSSALVYSADGRLELRSWTVTAHGTITTTTIDYAARSWSRTAQPVIPLPPGTGNCSTRREATSTPIPLPQLLACSPFVITGHDDIGGVETLKLTDTSHGGWVITVWVDPSTYLAARLTTVHHGELSNQTDFRWLAPAPATMDNLAAPQIPAGFRHVPGPLG